MDDLFDEQPVEGLETIETPEPELVDPNAERLANLESQLAAEREAREADREVIARMEAERYRNTEKPDETTFVDRMYNADGTPKTDAQVRAELADSVRSELRTENQYREKAIANAEAMVKNITPAIRAEIRSQAQDLSLQQLQGLVSNKQEAILAKVAVGAAAMEGKYGATVTPGQGNISGEPVGTGGGAIAVQWKNNEEALAAGAALNAYKELGWTPEKVKSILENAS